MSAYILLIILQGYLYSDTPQVAMQEFGDLKSCQFASAELDKLTSNRVDMVCVPKYSAKKAK